MSRSKEKDAEKGIEFDYDKWAESRSVDHDYLADLIKCRDMASLIPPDKKYGNILEIGCGFGGVLEYFGYRYDALTAGTDISDVSLKHCNKSCEGFFYKHDIDKGDLPFDKDEFDLVIIADIAEHVSDPEHLMKEALRVGKEIIIKLPLQYRPYDKDIPDKNGHLHFWPYYTDALLWLKQFPMSVVDYKVQTRRDIFNIAIYHKKGLVGLALRIFRRLNQIVHINIPREEGICVYAVKG